MMDTYSLEHDNKFAHVLNFCISYTDEQVNDIINEYVALDISDQDKRQELVTSIKKYRIIY